MIEAIHVTGISETQFIWKCIQKKKQERRWLRIKRKWTLQRILWVGNTLHQWCLTVTLIYQVTCLWIALLVDLYFRKINILSSCIFRTWKLDATIFDILIVFVNVLWKEKSSVGVILNYLELYNVQFLNFHVHTILPFRK